MTPPHVRPDTRLAPLRPFDRVVAGYATLAFALGAGERAAVREWNFALLGAILTAAGVVLLGYDHRRWRAARRAAPSAIATETS